MSEIKSAQCFEKALATVQNGNNLRRAFDEVDNLDRQVDGFYLDDTSSSNNLALCRLAEEFGKERHTVQRIEQTANTLYSFSNLINGIRRTKDRQTASQMVLKKNSFAKFLEKSMSWSDDYLNRAAGSQDSIGVVTSRSIGPEEWQNNAFAWVDNPPMPTQKNSEVVPTDSKTLDRQLQLLQAQADYAGLKQKDVAGSGMAIFGAFALIGSFILGTVNLKSEEGPTNGGMGIPALMGIGGAGLLFGGMAITPADKEIEAAKLKVRFYW